MTTPLDLRSQWDSYGRIWLISDDAEWAAAAEAALAADCTYTDPNVHTSGHAELLGYVRTFQQGLPGGHFVTTSYVEHHDRALAGWNMVTGDGAVVGTGHSFVTFAEDGKVSSLTGFFDAPSGA